MLLSSRVSVVVKLLSSRAAPLVAICRDAGLSGNPDGSGQVGRSGCRHLPGDVASLPLRKRIPLQNWSGSVDSVESRRQRQPVLVRLQTEEGMGCGLLRAAPFSRKLNRVFVLWDNLSRNDRLGCSCSNDAVQEVSFSAQGCESGKDEMNFGSTGKVACRSKARL